MANHSPEPKKNKDLLEFLYLKHGFSIRGGKNVFAKSVNWEENRELGVVRLHIFNSRISNSRKIPGPKKRELGGHTVISHMNSLKIRVFKHRNSYF